jgi:hydroxymethylbilane synthase
VHSLKDLPTRLPDGIVLACTPKREDPRDAFICKSAASLMDLPAGAVLGTASLRRQAQALNARPDLVVKTLRGNVETRLAKIESGAFDATFLALSGLKRLGLAHHAASLVDPDLMPPAACQGALAITARADDARALDLIAKLEDAATRLEIEAERAFLLALDGSCRTPIAALARRTDGALSFIGETLTPDGAQSWRRTETRLVASAAEARALGEALGQSIKHEAGDALMIEP